MDLCNELGWLEDAQYLDSPRASEDQLTRFHDPSYVQALKQADAQGSVSKEVRERYRIGTMENPVFSGLYERATTAVGGSILAAERALRGETAFHPSGGTHHGTRGLVGFIDRDRFLATSAAADDRRSNDAEDGGQYHC